jgi:hypothetical protein
VVPNPSLSFSPSTASVCPGQSQVFTISGANSYTWLPSSTSTLISSTSIVAKSSLTGFYSARGEKDGCYSDQKNAIMIVLSAPIVSVSALSPTVCSGVSTALMAEGNSTSYLWSPSYLLNTASGATVFASPNTTQSFTVTGSLNSCSTSAVISVSVVAVPKITAQASQSVVCEGYSTVLSASGAGSYIWNPTSGLNQPTGSAVIASPVNDITYIVRGFNGICTGSAAVNIKTVKLPDMQIWASQTQVCKGASATVTLSGAQNYSWSPSTGIVSGGDPSRVTIVPPFSTNYTISGSNSSGSVLCSEQVNYSLTVLPEIRPQVPAAVSICEGERTTLYARGGNTYKWSPGYGLNRT